MVVLSYMAEMVEYGELEGAFCGNGADGVGLGVWIGGCVEVAADLKCISAEKVD